MRPIITPNIVYTDLRETLNKLDNVLTEREKFSFQTLNRWGPWAADVASYLSNQLNIATGVPTDIESFLKGSGFSKEKKEQIANDPYYGGNLEKVANALNTGNMGSLGNTGPKSSAGTSFGGGDNVEFDGISKELARLQALAKEKKSAKDTVSYYAPLPPKDLQWILHGVHADAIEQTGAVDADVEPTWAGQTADDIRAELDDIYSGRENWLGKFKEWEDLVTPGTVFPSDAEVDAEIGQEDPDEVYADVSDRLDKLEKEVKPEPTPEPEVDTTPEPEVDTTPEPEVDAELSRIKNLAGVPNDETQVKVDDTDTDTEVDDTEVEAEPEVDDTEVDDTDTDTDTDTEVDDTEVDDTEAEAEPEVDDTEVDDTEAEAEPEVDTTPEPEEKIDALDAEIKGLNTALDDLDDTTPEIEPADNKATNNKREQDQADLRAELEADMEIERKREQRQADLRAELEADMEIENMSGDDWQAKFEAMSDEEFSNVDIKKLQQYGDSAVDGYLEHKLRTLPKSSQKDDNKVEVEPEVDFSKMSQNDYITWEDAEMDKFATTWRSNPKYAGMSEAEAEQQFLGSLSDFNDKVGTAPVVEPEVDAELSRIKDLAGVPDPVVEPEVDAVVEPEVDAVVEPEVDAVVDPVVEPVVEPEEKIDALDAEIKGLNTALDDLDKGETTVDPYDTSNFGNMSGQEFEDWEKRYMDAEIDKLYGTDFVQTMSDEEFDAKLNANMDNYKNQYDQAVIAQAEIKQIADEKARAQAEIERTANEKLKAQAEAKRIADEKIKAQAEAKRIADETAKRTTTYTVDDLEDYFANDGPSKDAARLKNYIRSGEAAKDAEAKGIEHKAYLDKKAGEVSDYFTGGDAAKDANDAGDWISKQWNKYFSDDKKTK